MNLAEPVIFTKPGEMLTAMLVLAVTRHAGQFDRGGKPYILHTLKVMHYLQSEDEGLNCIAVGHDLIEDTKTTYEELRQLGFTPRVIGGIRVLTKQAGETEQEQLDKILSNRDACEVKLQDLRHNADIRRLKGITDKDFARIAKYHRWYMAIKARLSQRV